MHLYSNTIISCSCCRVVVKENITLNIWLGFFTYYFPPWDLYKYKYIFFSLDFTTILNIQMSMLYYKEYNHCRFTLFIHNSSINLPKTVTDKVEQQWQQTHSKNPQILILCPNRRPPYGHLSINLWICFQPHSRGVKSCGFLTLSTPPAWKVVACNLFQQPVVV